MTDLSKSPYKILQPSERFVAKSIISDKEKYQILPPLVKKIRDKVSEWRKKGYPNTSKVTKALINWWFNTNHENFRYYFAQREAVETIIFLYEADKTRNKEDLLKKYNSYPEVKLKHFSEEWLRLVTKMATGSGKTKVMSLLIVWSFFKKIYDKDDEYGSNFLIIAPNIIVLDRLKDDFENLSIFRNDPCLPDDGYENYNWRMDFLNSFEVHIQKQLNLNKKDSNIFLTNIQQIYSSRESNVSLENENKTEFFYGKKVDSELHRQVDVLKIIKQIDNIVILNDEAHHINDEFQAWNKTIIDIHNNLSLREKKIILQLDFTATPKHRDSSIFVQTVSDYPLTEAIHQNIVKNIEVPDKNSRDKSLKEIDSIKFTEKWRNFIDLGYQKWKESFKFHKKFGNKKSIFFIMTDDTKNCDETARFIENNYEDLRGRVLVIHTKNNGEFFEKTSDLKSSKSLDELQKLRINANSIDSNENPYLAVVSVLVLKEGWDVNNVTTVVGLRPFLKPKILPEQTLGRGLRKMYRDKNLQERLTVIGTPNFMEFASELQKEGVKIKEINTEEDNDNNFFITSELRKNLNEVKEFDIEFPNLIEKIFNDEENIKKLDPSKFNFKVINYNKIIEIKKEKVIFEYSVSKEISSEIDFEKSFAVDIYNMLAALAKEVMFILKIKKGLGFAIICEKLKIFIEEYLWGKRIEFDTDLTKANLCLIETRRTIIETMVNELKRVMKNQKSETIISKINKFSDDKDPKVKNFEKAIYFEPKKSVYTKHFFANEFELDVNIYLENMPDVKSCIKNDGYIKIPYINNQGIYSQYIPDFFVKLKDDKVCIVETKGREDLDDIIKKTALEKRIEDINKKNDKSIYTSLYVKYDKFKNLSNKPSTFENFYELFKDL